MNSFRKIFRFLETHNFFGGILNEKNYFRRRLSSYLTKGAILVGNPGIPMLLDLKNTQIPKGLVPFNKIGTEKDKNKYVHFYIHDYQFSQILTSTKKYVDRLKQFDGVITPDCSMLINQAQCLQQTNTYFNRAIGFYLQKQGIPVIPNIRWSDEKSFEYCFLGVPKHSIVSISTHGCIRSSAQKEMFKIGLKEMIIRHCLPLFTL